MDEFTKNSEFYHFGILPNVCIHSPVEDEYSKMYLPRDKCECGSFEWIEGKMDIIKPVNGYQFPQKDVHRCKKCNEVRMADHIGVLNDWPFMNTDQETFFREWDHLGKEIWMNIGLRGQEISNGALNEILQENFLLLLQKFFGMKKK